MWTQKNCPFIQKYMILKAKVSEISDRRMTILWARATGSLFHLFLLGFLVFHIIHNDHQNIKGLKIIKKPIIDF